MRESSKPGDLTFLPQYPCLGIIWRDLRSGAAHPEHLTPLRYAMPGIDYAEISRGKQIRKSTLRLDIKDEHRRIRVARRPVEAHNRSTVKGRTSVASYATKAEPTAMAALCCQRC